MKINYSPITPLAENLPPGTVICGIPGSGKTFASLNFIYQTLAMGARVFALDAKNDLLKLKNTDMGDRLNFIDINNISPGALDPFFVLDDPSTNDIMDVITCITGDISDEKRVQITPIVNDFVTMNRRSNGDATFEDLVNYLYASDKPEAQAIGNELKVNQDSKYGPLLIGEFDTVNSKRFKLSDQSTVISLLGLPFPEATDTTLTADQRFSTAIIYIICKVLNTILAQDNTIPTLLMIDEAHIMFRSQAISSITMQFLVLGRSLNVATILASQNVTHFPNGIAQFCSTKFAFKLSREEAKNFLKLFNVSEDLDNESVINTIINFDNENTPGQCFMIDRRGRFGFLHIESTLTNQITSNPLAKKRN